MLKSYGKNKLVSRAGLAQTVKKLQKAGKKVVFTNGCFDLIHAGHIASFNYARSLGDALIVGLNSDKSLAKLKGPKRPLVSEKNRAKVLSALDCVDYIVIFGEDTPEKLLSELKPDILVKGKDYKLSEIAGRQFVKKVCRFPIVKGQSTSNLISLIVKRYG
ncbi:MAG: adenylyltransferase/cytidyltransferase family protein [Elusimicrobia bacterium]|nr:adenylyltransferase/cytidyltransferase family protein [Elusimicrobiota bacterium]